MVAKFRGSRCGLVLTTILTPLQVPIGSTGNIITITPPPGKRAVLLGLFCQTTSIEGNITVNAAGAPVITGILQGVNNVATGTGQFKIGSAALNSTAGAGPTVDMIFAPLPDQVITVSKSGGNTASTIIYVAAYGD